MLDQRSDTLSAEFLAEAHVVVALVGDEAPQVVCVPQGDLQADIRPIGPLRTTMDVDYRALRGIDEKCGLDGL